MAFQAVRALRSRTAWEGHSTTNPEKLEFPGKTGGETEHKKHYRTLLSGVFSPALPGPIDALAQKQVSDVEPVVLLALDAILRGRLSKPTLAAHETNGQMTATRQLEAIRATTIKPRLP